ncbi:MAG: sulfatase-like hydrolase/transferase, partial [Chloroflexota bacterium]|nr:sulfatase-like hydrolase/transferase [Chloroflexota bacterium]
MPLQASAIHAVSRLRGSGRRPAIVLAAAVVALLVAALVPAVQSQVRTVGADNVILIVPDDMRFDELAAMPELERLAERGIAFPRAFATTPLCCPSRASILTGRYARNHGVLRNSPPNGGFEAFDDRSTLATWLRAAGVRTGLVGRYLTGYEDTLYIPPGWDNWFGMWDADDGYWRYRVNHNGERKFFGTGEDEYSTRVFTREALRFLAEDTTRPFFLHVTPRAPHGPAREDVLDAGLFKDRELPLPPAYDEADVDDKPTWVRELPRLDEEAHEKLENFRRRTRGTLVSLDRGIAAIVEALRADGRLDRTWIMFMSDNGFMLGEHRITR